MPDARNPADLQRHYEKIYKKGAYENYFTFNSYTIWQAILDQISDWRGLNVLEVGCGQGELSAMLAYAGAKNIHAVDYSEAAIEIAKERVNLPNVDFIHKDGRKVDGVFDVITLAGVLEHIEGPWKFVDRLVGHNLAEGGRLISVMPSFINPRGYVWMTLQILFNVPMSLSDINFFSPSDVEAYAEKNGLDLNISTIDPDWGCGERLIYDFNKRLPNALRDAGIETDNIPAFMEWLKNANNYYTANDYSGALMVCTLTKKST